MNSSGVRRKGSSSLPDDRPRAGPVTWQGVDVRRRLWPERNAGAPGARGRAAVAHAVRTVSMTSKGGKAGRVDDVTLGTTNAVCIRIREWATWNSYCCI